MLIMAMFGFLLNFWAWALIGPLASEYRDELGLTPIQVSIAVAVPVLVGSLGRIPVGALTDRFGSRLMFPVISLLTIFPTLFVGLYAHSYPTLIIGGFFLGIGGTAFAIGVPLVNSWFAPERRGSALGLFGLGMGGTAIAAFTTVKIVEDFGRPAPFILVSVLLVIYATLAWMLVRDANPRSTARGSLVRRTWETFKLPATLQTSWIYAIGFGGFVAFSVYLPTYLVNAYDMTPTAAALRTAGFVALAVVSRPVGGILSDRWHPVPVLVVCFVTASAMAVLAALRLELLPAGTVAFLVLAATLGASSGACFALVSKVAPAGKVGAVTGIVGAAGGLGGFFPPLVMGIVYSITGHYMIGLLLLAVAVLGTAMFTWGPVRRASRTPVSEGNPA